MVVDIVWHYAVCTPGHRFTNDSYPVPSIPAKTEQSQRATERPTQYLTLRKALTNAEVERLYTGLSVLEGEQRWQAKTSNAV